ncbi:MAG TPA: PAS domain S-box protein [Candidatus Acidoferrum sp.]|nr:PAS domain S-box protein [Candidatus Acidoferrum sp.]
MSARIFPRSLLLLALAVVICHVLTVVFFGATAFGSLLGNALQILSSLVAAIMCFRAARKLSGFSHSFWTLVGFGMCMWGVADLGWTYYEVFLHAEPPPDSMIRFLFHSHGMFFVMAIFLNQEKTHARVEFEEGLDFVQIGIFFFLIYFGMHILPALNFGARDALAREMVVARSVGAGIILLGVLQWRRGVSTQARKLFGGLALYTLIYAIGAYTADAIQVAHQTPTGSWYDLAWTIPLLFGAFWAATWQPVETHDLRRGVHAKSLPEIVLTNCMFAFLPLVILFLAVQLAPGWRLIRFTLLGLSFVCYALRIGLTQFHQQKTAETVRRQTLAMDSSADGMGILNEKGLHAYANSSFARMLGFAGPESIIGQPWRTVYAFQDMDRLEPEIRRSLAQAGKWSSEILLHRPDGTKLPVELNISAMPDGGTTCVCRDLSKRAEAEKARAEAEAKYKTLVEQVNAITYIAEVGIAGQWFYVSPQVEAILGYTAEEWLGIAERWAQLIHPDDLPTVAAAEEASKSGTPFQAEFRIKRKDGREVWLNDTAVVVQGSNTHPVMEGIIVDITERKQLETQLQQSRKMEAVGRLAGGIAHDFNNLLTIITGYTELALSRPTVPPELRSDIERIENAAGRAAGLVRQLLAFSRRQVLQPKIIDVNGVVLNLDKLLRRLMDDNVEMVTHVQEEVGKVKADPAQLEQVIMNLVVNARDAMPNGGRLVVETANADLDASYTENHVSMKPGRYVMLAVSDTGVGMDRRTIAHIFEPFYTTKESGRGTGLGLSTVYGIVKQSGGHIWVYSEPGKGSTFKVYLPRVDGPVEETGVAQPRALSKRGAETILLVEDEEEVRNLIQTVLTEHGYDVIPARDPQHAEQLAATYAREIHLLLTDVVMPGTGGRELASRITPHRPDIRVLFMSGYTENVITSGGMLEKGLAFLQKPFTPAVLVEKVREVLNHTPAI